MRLGVLGMLMTAIVVLGPRTASADRYGITLINPDDPKGSTLGGLKVIDGRVFVSNETGGYSVGWLKEEEKGYTLRVTRGPQERWYLTGDKEGRVYLAKEPEEGSYWRMRFQGLGSFDTGLTVRGREEGPRAIAVDKEDTTYTDGAGKEYTVKRVRLVGGAKGEKGKPGSLFRFTVISP